MKGILFLIVEKLLLLQLLPLLISLFGLYYFASSFFLAKRTLSSNIYTAQCHEGRHILLEDILGLSYDETYHLMQHHIIPNDEDDNINDDDTNTDNNNDNRNDDDTPGHQRQRRPRRNGCYMDRIVDSMIIIVVDALRFDFAYYDLPNSIGQRLSKINNNNKNNNMNPNNNHGNNNYKNNNTIVSPRSGGDSTLLQFIADPPTVTMQRIKALTTGGLPTFADISNNMGGANVEDDTLLKLLVDDAVVNRLEEQGGGDNNNKKSVIDDDDVGNGQQYHHKKKKKMNKKNWWLYRGLSSRSKLAFVGDDTWEDLYPGIFDVSYPYPSFNTRDLDTVDNGCLYHIPDLIHNMRRTTNGGKRKIRGIDGNDDNDHDEGYELLIVHFLGVDHVGHTYGPHNEHMDTKLRQMDQALSTVLDYIDNDDDHDADSSASSSSCRTVFIMGDHGMTEDGNHGGGTPQEVQAALFVHSSPGCRRTSRTSSSSSSSSNTVLLSLLERETMSDLVQGTFASVHQIDLVPTIAIMLGIPIPYANLGSLIPGIMPSPPQSTSSSSSSSSSRTGSTTSNGNVHDMMYISTALAFNAAQVWRYYMVYDETANKLPNLDTLKLKLDIAVDAYRDAIQKHRDISNKKDNDDNDTDTTADSILLEKYQEACVLLKSFLTNALELGQRVWTRFDILGMISGIVILFIGLIGYILTSTSTFDHHQQHQRPIGSSFFNILRSLSGEDILSIVFMIIFYCGMLTFSNSYIIKEQHACMYMIAVLSIIVAIRILTVADPITTDTSGRTANTINNSTVQTSGWYLLLLPIAARMHELFVSGHGLDPSIPLHIVHHPVIFTCSLLILCIFRWYVMIYHHQQSTSISSLSSLSLQQQQWWWWHSCFADIIALFFMWISWYEKRIIDPNRNGFISCRIAMIITFLSLISSLLIFITSSFITNNNSRRTTTSSSQQQQQRVEMTTTTTKTTTTMTSSNNNNNINKITQNDKNNDSSKKARSNKTTATTITTTTTTTPTPKDNNTSLKTTTTTRTHDGQQELLPIDDEDDNNNTVVFMIIFWIKILIGIMIVTGPSAASSLVLYSIEMITLYQLSSSSINNSITTTARTTTSPGSACRHVHPIIIASLLKLITRHTFFTTNHGCSFNRLQLSSAFVATTEFYFTTAGISLFLNTFGWEISGIIFSYILSRNNNSKQQQHKAKTKSSKSLSSSFSSSISISASSSTFHIYMILQLFESLTSCISVSILRRHLMVWDIYAPHFLFVFIYTMLHGFIVITILILQQI